MLVEELEFRLPIGQQREELALIIGERAAYFDNQQIEPAISAANV